MHPYHSLKIPALVALLLTNPASFAAGIPTTLQQWQSGVTSANQTSLASFAGGVTADAGQSLATSFVATQALDVLVDVRPAAEHVGKTASFYTVARFNEQWFMKNTQGQWLSWNQQLSGLVSSSAPRTLKALENIEVVTQLSGLPGKFEVFVGYQVDKDIHYNPKPFSFSVALANPSAAGVPDLMRYSFTSQESKVLPGKSTELNASSSSCNGVIVDSDQLGRLALVASFYQNACYTDGRYNHNNYLVERGVLSSNGSQTPIEAYRIHEASTKAKQFLASQHVIYYRFPTKEDYTLYRFDGVSVNKVTQVAAAQIDTSRMVAVANVTASQITGDVTYLFVPSSQRLSTFTEYASGIEAARVNTTTLGDVIKYRYSVDGKPFDTKLDFNYGPSTHSNVYSLSRQFFLVANKAGQRGIVWQDKNDGSVQVTWLGNDFKTQETVNLPFASAADLVGVTADESGNLFYLMVQSGSGVSSSGDIARVATLYKTTATGQELLKKTLDTSATGLNIANFGTGNVASLNYTKGTLGLIIGRQMHRGSDGLNHQGAIAAVFDANNLALLKNWGQTSGHSFGSVLTTNAQNEFVGIDLGDNYPRGINLHKFTQSSKSSRVVYTFKTQHGSTATSPAGVAYPAYPEISSGSTAYFKWSNDNRTYTELGGVIDGNNGYSVVFAGEKTTDGRALDNARVGDYLNDPRNIGLVLVRKDFENASGTGNVVSDDLIRTAGSVETGGFYTFGGAWSAQRNKGVIWLTHYLDKQQENASRLKSVKLKDGNLLLVWEKWTATAYVNTYAMKVDEAGNSLTPIVELGTQVRLNRRDDLVAVDNQVYIVAGEREDKKLEFIVLQMK